MFSKMSTWERRRVRMLKGLLVGGCRNGDPRGGFRRIGREETGARGRAEAACARMSRGVASGLRGCRRLCIDSCGRLNASSVLLSGPEGDELERRRFRSFVGWCSGGVVSVVVDG